MSVFGMGGMEIMVIMIVALIIFGPGKLPEIGAQVGRAVRDFRRATDDLTREFNDSTSDIRSTMDEMKGTMAEVEQESRKLAQSIPASIEGAVSPQNANGRATAEVAQASSQPAAVSQAVTEQPATPAEPVVVPTRNDPLADLELLDDDALSGRSSAS
jgi:sec-independent protein translocase protein TatB